MSYQLAVSCGKQASGRTPHFDVYENDEELLLIADVPGAKADQVEVNIERQLLTLAAGEHKRSFRVPLEVDAERITADAKAGVVTLHLPKSERAKPRRISVAVS